MKQIKLTQGQFALVDDADYDWLNQYKWFAHKSRGNFYAGRMSPTKKGTRYAIRMHRQIFGLEHDDKRDTDHINHNTLDNHQENLRICTHRQNMKNQKKRPNTTSKYKGVCWKKKEKKWYVRITVDGNRISLGRFTDEKEAATAYNKAAKKYFGNFAYLNVFP